MHFNVHWPTCNVDLHSFINAINRNHSSSQQSSAPTSEWFSYDKHHVTNQRHTS